MIPGPLSGLTASTGNAELKAAVHNESLLEGLDTRLRWRALDNQLDHVVKCLYIAYKTRRHVYLSPS